MQCRIAEVRIELLLERHVGCAHLNNLEPEPPGVDHELGECRELGSDNRAWRLHAVESLCELVGGGRSESWENSTSSAPQRRG